MATKKELEQMIQDRDKSIKELVRTIGVLESKIAETKNKADDMFCNSITYKQMQNEIEYLKTQINIRCNLGRKQKFSDDEKATIQMLRLAGNSYRAIAKQMGCSVGTIHKIIKELDQR